MNDDAKYIFRYTTVVSMLDILRNKRLILLNPENWQDKNDSELLKKYAKKIGEEKHISALCFTLVEDSVLHWNIPTAECRIKFDLTKLIGNLNAVKGVRHERVQYRTIQELQQSMKKQEIELQEWPFIKRWPYRAEEEYRIIWEGKATEKDGGSVDIPIDIECIKRITISQHMPECLFKTLKEIIIGMNLNDIKIQYSNLTESKIFLSSFK
jgi:hypothetical protein